MPSCVELRPILTGLFGAAAGGAPCRCLSMASCVVPSTSRRGLGKPCGAPPSGLQRLECWNRVVPRALGVESIDTVGSGPSACMRSRALYGAACRSQSRRHDSSRRAQFDRRHAREKGREATPDRPLLAAREARHGRGGRGVWTSGCLTVPGPRSRSDRAAGTAQNPTLLLVPCLVKAACLVHASRPSRSSPVAHVRVMRK